MLYCTINMTRVRKKKRITALSRESADPLWQLLDKKIGGRKGLLEAALVSQNPKAPILAELCLDRAFSRSGTKDLARKAGMGAEEIVDLYRNKKWLEATLNLHEKLPEVIAGAVEDAAPSRVVCEECRGKLVDKDGNLCWLCKGKGDIRKPGDQKKLEFVGEAVGMTSKSGPMVQVNTQINAPGQTDTFESLMRKAVVKIERK